MHLDSAQRLLLTATLAAAACQPISASVSNPDTGGADPVGSHTSSGASPDADTTLPSETEPSAEPGTAEPEADCDNQVGGPATCSLADPAGHCEVLEYTQQVCDVMATALQPRGATAAVACMMAANGTDRMCSWELANECLDAGVQASCIEPATRSECESIHAQCNGSIDVTTCQRSVSAMQPDRQSEALACVRESCDTANCLILF